MRNGQPAEWPWGWLFESMARSLPPLSNFGTRRKLQGAAPNYQISSCASATPQANAKRMATCCANNSAQFRPDCYSWCNVDLPSGLPGFDPVILELRRFSMCLQEGEDVHYTPRMLCMNGTKNDAPSPSTSAPAGPTSTSSAMGWKDLGKSTWVVLGLILLQTALEQCF